MSERNEVSSVRNFRSVSKASKASRSWAEIGGWVNVTGVSSVRKEARRASRGRVEIIRGGTLGRDFLSVRSEKARGRAGKSGLARCKLISKYAIIRNGNNNNNKHQQSREEEEEEKEKSSFL